MVTRAISRPVPELKALISTLYPQACAFSQQDDSARSMLKLITQFPKAVKKGPPRVPVQNDPPSIFYSTTPGVAGFGGPVRRSFGPYRGLNVEARH